MVKGRVRVRVRVRVRGKVSVRVRVRARVKARARARARVRVRVASARRSARAVLDLVREVGVARPGEGAGERVRESDSDAMGHSLMKAWPGSGSG